MLIFELELKVSFVEDHYEKMANKRYVQRVANGKDGEVEIL